MMKSLASAVLLALGASTAGHADEVWDTQWGPAFYETDVAGYGVLRLSVDDSGDRRIYVSGLPSRISARAGRPFEGYWIDLDGEARSRDGEGAIDCGFQLTGPDGAASSAWGRIRISFEESGFPSGFEAHVDECASGFTDSFFAAPETEGVMKR